VLCKSGRALKGVLVSHPAGDPIEVGALAGALAGGSVAALRRAPPALLSSKACYGHTEGTAGLAGDTAVRGSLLVLCTLRCTVSALRKGSIYTTLWTQTCVAAPWP
jgi:Beta-ketoacyl synthase, C-terminal domain